jgi:two-component system response regulator VicR
VAYKILVVDDEPDIVESVKNRLIREGYDVFTAYDGEEALVRVAENDPDVVVLDLTMPKLNGFEVLRRVRLEFNDRWRPVIIVSASTDLDSLKKCYGLEADHYLTKPCTLDTLVRGIETMISLIPLRAK